MRKVLLLALNDLRRTVRERQSFFWMLIFPMILMWLFGYIPYGGGSEPPSFYLAVENRDDGWLAGAVIEDLGKGQVDLHEVPEDEAPGEVRRTRTVIVPEGFTENVLAGEQQELRLVKDPEANADFSLAAEVHVIRTIVRTLGRLVELNATDDGLDGEPGELSGRFRELGERPPLVTLEVSTAGSGRSVPSGTAQSVPGILTMTVLMMTVMFGAVFLAVDRRTGALRRQATLPVGPWHIIAGKLGGRLILALAQIVLLLLAGRLLFGLSYGNSIAGLTLLMVSYAAAVSGLATMLGALVRTEEQAEALGWLITMAMAALGGCWWPIEIVPEWLRIVAHTQPTAWAMDGFHALISFGRGFEGVVVPSLVLLGFGVVFSAIGARHLLRTEGRG